MAVPALAGQGPVQNNVLLAATLPRCMAAVTRHILVRSLQCERRIHIMVEAGCQAECVGVVAGITTVAAHAPGELTAMGVVVAVVATLVICLQQQLSSFDPCRHETALGRGLAQVLVTACAGHGAVSAIQPEGVALVGLRINGGW